MSTLTPKQLISLSLPTAMMDVSEERHVDIVGFHHSNQSHQENDVLFAFQCDCDEGWRSYAMLENGAVWKVSTKTIDDGVTWNGDDVYTKSYKVVFTFIKKIGTIKIIDCDYNDDKHVENIAHKIIDLMNV